MKTYLAIVSLIIVLSQNTYAQTNEKLWYTKPAAVWTEALPVGNGRLGAMVFGGLNQELIQLNENSLWSGGPVPQNINPEAAQYLPQIRKVLMEQQDYAAATAIAKKMQGLYTENYLPLADLVITQQFKVAATASYHRELNIKNAITTTRYTADGIEYTREIFSSAPDQVIVIRLTTNKPKKLNFVVSAKSKLPYQNIVSGKNELLLKGKAPAHSDPNYVNSKNPVIWEDPNNCAGMRYELIVRAINKDGVVKTDTSGISVTNASEVILLLSATTSFNGFDKCPAKDGKDEHKLARAYLDKAIKKPYTSLLSTHQADYRKYYNRVTLQLKDSLAANANRDLPSDERLKAYSTGAYDPGIEELYFNYGRYLLISSSRPGGMPANLQGIWNNELRPPWSSNYTININTQMNYWPAEVTNLSEMHLPLFDLIKNISVTGKRTAKEFYNMNGWVAHHNSDIWATSNPVGNKGEGDPKWANWPQGANWLSQHLWEHYSFNQDKNFLRQTAYPLMKGAAEFCLDWLVEDTDGYLVMVPSTSPENDFRYPGGKVGSISIATTMDMSIIWDLFTNLIQASTELGIDKEFRDVLIAKKAKLYPLHIGSKGNLQEWYKDFQDVDPKHRHVSHLFGLHPGRQITPLTTPAFAAAAKKTLEIRGDEGTGWSKAWKINFWARLLDGNHAYLLLRQLLKYSSQSETEYSRGGGTYPNFFDAHPPFQIDGNFGGTAGISEMLLQSHLGELHLLPALPDVWKEGSVKGLKGRGNYMIAINWKNGKLTDATITASADGECKIRTGNPVQVKTLNVKAQRDRLLGYVLSFKAEKGKTYQVEPL
jgi:alpha-L-fucosidase 2